MMKNASIGVLMLFSILESFSQVEGSKLGQQLTDGTFRLGKFHTPINFHGAVRGVEMNYLYNWVFHDPNMDQVPAKFPSTCQVHCEATPKCQYWTWMDGKCFMKETGEKMALQKSGYVSGYKRFHMPHHCFHRGMGFRPDARSKIGDAHALTEGGDKSLLRQCKEACDGSEECHFFMQKGLDCTFYGRSAMRYMIEDADAVIGPKECNDGWCYSVGMSFGDTSQGFVKYEFGKMGSKVITAQLCQAKCFSQNRCVFWYNDKSGTCHMFTSGAPTNQIRDIHGGVTGINYCGTTGPACFAENTELSGDLLRHMKANTIVICQRSCYIENKCYFFSYHTPTQMCKLWDSTANGTGEKKEGVTSGPYKCYYDI